MSTLEDVIAGRTFHCIWPAASAREAAERMAVWEVSALPVVLDADLVGVITERDLVHRLLAASYDPDTTPVSQIMSNPIVTASPRETCEEALARMTRHRVRHLLVVSGDRFDGLVSMRDLLVVDALEKSAEIELLTAYIYAVPPVLPPVGPALEEWAHTL
jgi:CBS domain-containing protein